MALALPKTYHRNIFFFGLMLMAIGLPLSKFLMSLSQFILIGNWIIEGDIKQKVKKFWQNKSAVILCSIFLLHLIGLFYTSDFNYGLKDAKTKLPLFIFPFIIASSDPLNLKQFKQLMLFFVLAVFSGTVVSMAVFCGIIKREVIDIRDISIFISHIRFSLMIDLAIFILGYYAYYEKNKTKKIIGVIFVIWLVVFLFILNSLTGIFVLLFTALILFCFYVVKSKKPIQKMVLLSGVLLFCAFLIYHVFILSEKCGTTPLKITALDELTPRGKAYFHDLNRLDVENGSYVYQYICEEELEEEWNKKSSIKYKEPDKKGNEIKYTLIRYMTSKGLRKDGGGVNKLTENDIQSIQKGIANINYTTMVGWNARLCEIFWEIENYKKGGNPNGHSVAQRYEYWKTAAQIIKTNLLFGVGTGDVKNAFDDQYEKTNSTLTSPWRLRAHNQYLSMAVAFGLVGLLCFLFSLFYPIVKEKKLFDYFYITFFIIVILSMLTEDTLETQAGVSFYVFFNSLFLFQEHFDS